MVRKILVVGVLENENSALAKQISVEHERHNRFAALQIVGCVGKNKVELLGAALQVEEDIRLNGVEMFEPEASGRLPDEVVVYGIDLHGRHAARTARGEFVADRPRAGEEVQHVDLLEVEEVVQHIEQVLLGEVRRGTCPEVARRHDGAAAVFAADYSHVTRLK